MNTLKATLGVLLLALCIGGAGIYIDKRWPKQQVNQSPTIITQQWTFVTNVINTYIANEPHMMCPDAQKRATVLLSTNQSGLVIQTCGACGKRFVNYEKTY